MLTVYICFDSTYLSILGIATSEASARQICNQLGDSYCPTTPDVDFRSEESTHSEPLAFYNVGNGVFVPYEELEQYFNEGSKVISLEDEREKKRRK